MTRSRYAAMTALVLGGAIVTAAPETVAARETAIASHPSGATGEAAFDFASIPGGVRLTFAGLAEPDRILRHAGGHLILHVGHVADVLSRIPGTERRALRIRRSGRDLDIRLAPGAIVRTEETDTALTVEILPAPVPPPSVKTDLVASGHPRIDGPDATRPAIRVPSGPLGVLPAPFVALELDDAPKKSDGAAAVQESVSPAAAATMPPSGTDALPLRASIGEAGSALLPFPTRAGIAVRERLGMSELFFDEPRALDAPALRSVPGMERAEVIEMPNAVVVRIPTPPGKAIEAIPEADGWRIRWTGATVADAVPWPDAGGEFAVPQPEKTIVVHDPDDEGLLLIGTTRTDHPLSTPARHSPLFDVDASTYGVVVAPRRDDIELDRSRRGFRLMSEGGPLPLLDVDQEQAFSGGPSDGLGLCGATGSEFPIDLRSALRGDVRLPLRERLLPRLALARLLISYGLAAEARPVLAAAAADDPAFATIDQARGLRAIADLLSGGEGDPEDWAALQRLKSPDAALWSMLAGRTIATAGSPSSLPARLRIADCYRPRLRELVAGLAAGISDGADGGSQPSRVLSGPASDTIASANAIARTGHAADARILLDRLAHRRDLGEMASGMLARTEFDVSNGRMSPAAAATFISDHMLDWRVSGRTADAFVGMARYQRAAGRYEDAIRSWKRAAAQGGSARVSGAAVHDILASLVDPSLRPAATTADLLAARSENEADLATMGDVRRRLDATLLDRLDAAALPRAAAVVVSRMIVDADPGIARERLELRLVQLRLAAGDASGARVAFDALPAPGDPSELGPRQIALAGLLEAERRPDAEILAAIDGNTTIDADRIRARADEADGRWHDAKSALLRLEDGFPTLGPLSAEQASVVLDLASVAVRDGDQPLAANLAQKLSARLPDPSMRTDLARLASPL